MSAGPTRRAGRVVIAGLLLALCLPGRALPGEPPRFPSPHITAEQWQALYDEVRAKADAQDISRPELPGIIAIAVSSEFTVYYFTAPGPVHPAVIIQRMALQDGQMRVGYSGYFAGSEEAFAKWFDSFRRRSEGVRDVLQPPDLICPDGMAPPCP